MIDPKVTGVGVAGTTDADVVTEDAVMADIDM
jgi:hypothetical protein